MMTEQIETNPKKEQQETPKQEYVYKTRLGKVKTFKSKQAYDNFIARLEKLKENGKLGGRPTGSVQGNGANSSGVASNPTSASSPAPVQLNNDEEKKRLEAEKEKKSKELTSSKKIDDEKFKQSVLVIAIIVSSVILVVIFIFKPKLPKLFGGDKDDSGNTQQST